LSLGGIYALFAVCVALSYSITRSLNLGVAVTFSAGALASAALAASKHSEWIAILGGALAGGIAGIIVDLVAGLPFRLRSSGPLAPIAAGFGVMVLGFELVGPTWRWTGAAENGVPPFSAGASPDQIIGAGYAAFAVAGLSLVAVQVLIRGTRFGLALRAIAGGVAAARAAGLNVAAVTLQTTFVAGALGALSGAAYRLLDPSPGMYSGVEVTLPAIVAVLVSGGRSLPGAAIAGLAAMALFMALRVGAAAAFGAAPESIAIASIGATACSLAAAAALTRGIMPSRSLGTR